MRTAITIAWPHRGDPKIIVGPGVGLSEHRNKFRELPPGKSHPEFAKVETWTSDSVSHSRKFTSPEAEKQRVEDQKKSAEREYKAVADAKEATERPKREADEKAAREKAKFVEQETAKEKAAADKRKPVEQHPRPAPFGQPAQKA